MSVRDCVQCSADTQSGDRCSRRTCLYFDMCWQHTRVHKHLYLSESGIPRSGLGLYTSIARRDKQKIADYTGQVKSTTAWNAGGEGNYGIKLNRNEVLDARSTQTALGRYANDCRKKNKKKRHCSGLNAKIAVNSRTKTASLRATKNIRAHSEIFVGYGAHFWKNR